MKIGPNFKFKFEAAKNNNINIKTCNDFKMRLVRVFQSAPFTIG